MNKVLPTRLGCDYVHLAGSLGHYLEALRAKPCESAIPAAGDRRGVAQSLNGILRDSREAGESRFDTVSFLSDYGTSDEFAGVVRAVIRDLAPHGGTNADGQQGGRGEATTPVAHKRAPPISAYPEHDRVALFVH